VDIVWFAEIKWDYLRTRKQQIISRKPDDVRLLYLEPYVRGRENRFDLREVDGVDRMWCATVPFVKAIPGGLLGKVSDSAFVRNLVDANALARAKKLTRKVGFDRGVTGSIISNIYAVHVASRFGSRFIAYDCNDAHSEFPGMPDWTHGYFEGACHLADTVFATSSVLVDEVGEMRGGEGVTFLGNGVDYGHFERERERLGRSDVGDTPCIGYLGAVAPWFDFDAVEHLARARPDWRVHIVGPVLPGVDREIERLNALDNVEFDGAVAYEDVPSLMRSFTVGLIPFRYDGLTRAVNPNKMYEYLAMGVPVVATRFSPEVQQYPGLVTAAVDADEFLVACDEFVALASDQPRADAFCKEAYAVAGENDWGVIAHDFWERVRACSADAG
jgi:glycosyltransferase involved in cell wall biosynthesis